MPPPEGQGFVEAAADGLTDGRTDGWMGSSSGSKEGTRNNLYDRSAVCEKAINGQVATRGCKKEERESRRGCSHCREGG